MDPDTFKLENREQFLASGPNCDVLTTWFSYNPRDEDVETVRRHVEECGTIPEALDDNGAVFLELRSEIFEATDPEGDETREMLHKALAAEACFNFGNDERSPYDVADDVNSAGGLAEDTSAILDIAAGLCSEHADDLQAFKDVDLIAAADDLTSFANERWPDALAGTPELLGMAQMVCNGSSESLDAGMTDSLLDTGLADGSSGQFRTYVRKNMCR